VEIQEEGFDLAGSGGERVRGEVRRPAGRPGRLPVVVVLHGFKAFRKWGFFPWIGRRIAEQGFASLVFDFSHNGTDASGEAYPRRDLFRNLTWRTHQEDLDAVLRALVEDGLPGADHLDPGRVALLGHSLGGGLAVVEAARRPGFRCVVGLAPVNRADRFSAREKETWRARGELPIVNSRTGEVLPLGLGYLEDAEARAGELDAVAAAARLPCPLLVVHGSEDTSVPPGEGHSLVESAIASGRPARFARIDGTQHTFDAVHPFAGETRAMLQAWAEVSAFLETYLVRFNPLDPPRGGSED